MHPLLTVCKFDSGRLPMDAFSLAAWRIHPDKWYRHQNSLSDGASKFQPSSHSLQVWVIFSTPVNFLKAHKREAGRKIDLVVAGTALAYEAPAV